MHPIWHFFDTMPQWAQTTVLATMLGCIVFAGKVAVAKSSGLIRSWLEHRLEKSIVGALAGDGETPLYLTTVEIAECVNRKAVRVLRSLERLEAQKRVTMRPMHNQKKWCLTIYEWHDKRRH